MIIEIKIADHKEYPCKNSDDLNINIHTTSLYKT